MVCRRRISPRLLPPSQAQALCLGSVAAVSPLVAVLVAGQIDAVAVPLALTLAPLFLVVAALYATLCLSDTAPDKLRAKERAVDELRRRQFCNRKRDDGAADRYRHVIEAGFCNVCRVDVPQGTKHCRTCARCADGFDHHCIWLNVCIGRWNYRLFLWLITTSTLLVLLVLVDSLVLVFSIFWPALTIVRAPSGDAVSLYETAAKHPQAVDCHIFHVPVWAYVFMAVVVTLITLVTSVLTVSLLGFHVRLLTMGMSTYNYILTLRAKSKVGSSSGTITTTTMNLGTIRGREQQKQQQQHHHHQNQQPQGVVQELRADRLV